MQRRTDSAAPKIIGRRWLDNDQTNCSLCHTQLKKFHRHHCRLCGDEFCDQHIARKAISQFLPYIYCVYEEKGATISITRLNRDPNQQFYICGLCDKFVTGSRHFLTTQQAQNAGQTRENQEFQNNFNTPIAADLIFDLIRYTAIELKKIRRLQPSETDTSKVRAYAEGQMAATIPLQDIEPLVMQHWREIYESFITHLQTTENSQPSNPRFPYIIRLNPFFLRDTSQARNFFLDGLHYELSPNILEYSGLSDGLASRSVPISLRGHLAPQITDLLMRSFFAAHPVL